MENFQPPNNGFHGCWRFLGRSGRFISIGEQWWLLIISSWVTDPHIDSYDDHYVILIYLNDASGEHNI